VDVLNGCSASSERGKDNSVTKSEVPNFDWLEEFRRADAGRHL
jgi:hypothetical protein